MLAADQGLIVEHAPRFASSPWFCVSSRHRLNAVCAAADGHQAEAAALEERSRFGPLEETLTLQIAARTAELRTANAAWVARRVVEKLAADQQRRLRSLTKDPELIATVRAKQAQLAEQSRADAGWRRELDEEFRKLGKDMQTMYTRRAGDLQAEANRWIADADAETATQIAHDFDARLRALWTDLESSARAGAVGIAARIATALGGDGVDAPGTDVPYPEQLARAADLQLTPEAPPDGFADRLTRLWPSLGGFSMTALAVHTLFASVIVPPLALVTVGGVVAAILAKGHHDRAATARARADLLQHLQSVLGQVRFEIPNAVNDVLEQLKIRIRDTVTGRMAARQGELTAAIAAANRHLEESEQVLAPQRAATEQALRRLRLLADRAGQLTASSAGAP